MRWPKNLWLYLGIAASVGGIVGATVLNVRHKNCAAPAEEVASETVPAPSLHIGSLELAGCPRP